MGELRALVYVCMAGMITVAGHLVAQNIAELTGEVIDPSNAAIAGAEISARNLATNFTVQGTTTIFRLPPGSYSIKAQAPFSGLSGAEHPH
jgi:hypothetical protein